jgi:hypothetical protein
VLRISPRCVAALLAAVFSAGAQDFSAASHESSARVVVSEVAGRKVSPRTGAVVDVAYEGEGIEVKVAGHGVSEDEKVFVLVTPQDSVNYRTFEAHKQSDSGSEPVWVARDVIFPDEGAQRKRFSLRAAVAAAGPATDSSDPLARFASVSTPPTLVAVLRWLPASPVLRIETIHGVPVEPYSPFTTDTSADITGKAGEGRGYIYVVTHPVNSDFWRVVKEAERRGSNWYCRDARLVEDGQPDSRYVDVFAIESAQPLPIGPMHAQNLQAVEVSWSYSVRVVIGESIRIPPSVPVEVQLQSYSTSAGTDLLEGVDRVKTSSAVISLEGTVTGMSQGKAIWCVLNAVGTAEWIVQEGPAIITGTRWNLPIIRLDGPSAPGKVFQLYVISADAALPAGVVTYATWHATTNGESRRLLVERNLPRAVGREISLRVSRIGGAQIQPNAVDVVRPPAGPIEVDAEIPEGFNVWVGKSEQDSGQWQFQKAVKNGDEAWRTPPVRWPSGATSREWDIVAIAAPGGMVVPDGPPNRWHALAWAESPYLIVTDRPKQVSGSNDASGLTSQWRWIMLYFLLVLTALAGVLVLGEWLWRISSSTLDHTAKYLRDVCTYLSSQVDTLGKIDVARSLFGLILVGLGLFAIWTYLPIYQKVLRAAFDLSTIEGHSLALLLVTFVALTGIVGDVTVRYGKPAQPTVASQFIYFFLVFLLIMFACALLFFQGMLYREFYLTRAPDGSPLPGAFATAAVFIAGVELLNFYWGSQFALTLIAWLLMHLVFMPIHFAAYACFVVADGLRRLPSRSDKRDSESEAEKKVAGDFRTDGPGPPIVEEA